MKTGNKSVLIELTSDELFSVQGGANTAEKSELITTDGSLTDQYFPKPQKPKRKKIFTKD